MTSMMERITAAEAQAEAMIQKAQQDARTVIADAKTEADAAYAAAVSDGNAIRAIPLSPPTDQEPPANWRW